MPGTVRPSPCSISACRLVAGATLLGLLPATCAWAGPAHVDQAVLLLRGGCALDNANLDMSTGNDGPAVPAAVGGRHTARQNEPGVRRC